MSTAVCVENQTRDFSLEWWREDRERERQRREPKENLTSVIPCTRTPPSKAASRLGHPNDSLSNLAASFDMASAVVHSGAVPASQGSGLPDFPESRCGCWPERSCGVRHKKDGTNRQRKRADYIGLNDRLE